MFQRITSVAVAFLVFGTLLWGSCPACAALLPSSYAQTSGEHDCCPEPGQKHSDTHETGQPCSGEIASPEAFVASHAHADAALAAPAPAVLSDFAEVVQAPVPTDEAVILGGPPDLFLHNATLLI